MATIGNRWDLIFIPSGLKPVAAKHSEDEAQQASPQEARNTELVSRLAPQTSPKNNFATFLRSVIVRKAY